ncbi:MAG: TlpA family protein disulfide reductase [Nitrospirae bacterium]|nr:TlpA family protein disulfide reductase [Nitrospirota bacterium]
MMMNRKRLIISIIFFAAVFEVIALSGNAAADSLLEWKMDSITGTQAPGFTITDLKGNKVSLSDFNGKPVLLNFWATWCPYCRRERPELDALQGEYGKKGLIILSVANDNSMEKVRQFIDKNPVSFTVLSDKDSIVTDTYGVYAMPTNFVIDKEGKIRHKFTGYRSWSDSASRKLLDELVK